MSLQIIYAGISAIGSIESGSLFLGDFGAGSPLVKLALGATLSFGEVGSR
jgi:hypothetical protein